MLALDLGVVNRKAHVITWREAGIWSAIWIGLALAFNAAVYVWQGPEVGLQFLTGYLIEKSLSVDNIFVFVLIFAAFGVPAAYQHRVLFWGVLGALVMRGALIGLGTALIASNSWVLYLFGAFLVITGIRMARPAVHEMHPERNPVVLIAEVYHMPIALSLGLIAVFLGAAIVASLVGARRGDNASTDQRHGQPVRTR